MAQPRILKLGILADTSDLVKGLKTAEGAVNDSGSRIGEGFKKVGIAVAAAGAAVGAFAIALGKQSIEAAIQAESEQNRLAQILRTTGATEREIAVLDQQARALEQVGVVSGGNIKVLQSQLATFDLQAATIQKLTPAILDYVTAEKGATASADDFKSMTNGLAQALNGNFASLTKTGFVLDENTKNMIKNGTETERAEALVQVLNSTYKGFNETLAETSEGRLIQLRNNLDTIKERIGNVLLPVLQQLTEFFVQQVLPVIDNLVERFERDASPAIDKFRKVIVDFVLPALQNMWGFIQQFVIPTLKNIFIPVVDILRAAFDFLTKKVKENKEGFQVFAGIIERVIKFIRDQLSPLIGGVLSTALNLAARAVGSLIDTFGKFFELVGKVAKFLGFDLDFTLDLTTRKINNLDSGIVDAYKSFAEQSRVIKQEAIPSLIAFNEATNELTTSKSNASKAATKLKDDVEILYNSTKKATQANKQYKNSVDELKRSFTDVEVTKTFAGGAGSVVGAFSNAADAAALRALIAQAENTPISELNLGMLRDPGSAADLELINLAQEIKDLGAGRLGFADLKKMFEQFQVTNIPFITAGSAEALTQSLGRRGTTAAEREQFVQEVNIYVQGLVADPEGTARAVQQVIQQSNGRAGNLPLVPALGIN